MMKQSCFLLFSFLILSCSQSNESGYFVTLLGNDTLAIEQFEKTEEGMIAKVLLRSPRTVFHEYKLELDETGGIQHLTQYQKSADQILSNENPIYARDIKKVGDSLITELQTNNGSRRLATLNKPGTLPFIDMVHWPYEMAFVSAAKNDGDSIHQMLLSGRRISDFIIHKETSDSLTLRHPSRGVMGVDVDVNGHLVKLDAALTTRKLIVKRVDEMDFDKLVVDFAERDKNGSPFSGSLSGAIVEDFSFKSSDFKVQYGSPKKRGRQIFGGIVPYGQRWRTGANRATHFSTTRDLAMGDLEIPAGEYTLFTIPEADGGTLIINKQTGQNGRSYNESRDLGRIPLSRKSQDGITENFTIKVEETTDGGVLKLIWDQTVLYANFTIK